ncbi:MAG: O-sialoglycoprotein endopeptidase, partial [Eubacteriales bacterium]|nr:O-sialoglycoprotein endopeptidase [Eubacteriales bacterium]
CLARTLAKLIINSLECFQISSFLLAGGVASSLILNRMLRERLRNSGVRLFFAEPKLASDNAVGIALLTGDLFEN